MVLNPNWNLYAGFKMASILLPSFVPLEQEMGHPQIRVGMGWNPFQNCIHHQKWVTKAVVDKTMMMKSH